MDPIRPAPFIATLTGLTAGGVHLAVAGPHLKESVVLGVGFVLTAWLQILLGALLWRWRSQVVGVALGAVHVGSVAAWAISSTIGLPVGHAGPEPLGLAGVVTVALELSGLVALLVWARPDRGRRLRVGAASLSVGLVLAVASVAVADGAQGHPAVHAHAPASNEGGAAAGSAGPESVASEPMPQESAPPKAVAPADVTELPASLGDGRGPPSAALPEEGTPHPHTGTDEHDH